MKDKEEEEAVQNLRDIADTRKKIRQINRLFGRIEEIRNSLVTNDGDTLDNLFNEQATLRHCIRWGVSTSEEMLRILKGRRN